MDEKRRPEWLVLTSRTAGNWPSLKIILGHLEAECLSAAIQQDAPFELVVLESGWRPKPAQLASVKVLILLHVDPQALALAAACRELFPDIKLVFFLAAEASALCPTFFQHSQILTLTSQDLFITLCRADAQLVQNVFPGASTQVLGDLNREKLPAIISPVVKKFVYAGRISFNKNLHNLILAYSLALKEQPLLAPLHIYGFQDASVQQFNETFVLDYQQKLLEVVAELTLTTKVIFHPYVSGPAWRDLLLEEGLVYVSASLNADENYALAPREFLATGQRAILPNWGGFRDIVDAYPQRTRGVAIVRTSTQTAHLNLTHYAQALIAGWNPCPAQNSSETPLIKLLHVKSAEKKVLRASPEIEGLHRELKEMKQNQWHDAGPYRYLHASSALVEKQLNAYATSPVTPRPTSENRLVPWVTNNSSVFEETETVSEDGHWQCGWLY